jgi:thiol-disulfide isomerase/thioredoxin
MRPIILFIVILILLLLLLRMEGRQYEGFESSSKKVVVFKADWCKHCQTAAPEFEKMTATPMTLKDGSKVAVQILDADRDKEEVKKYTVKGFPTILIMDGANQTEYPGERTKAGVLDFLNSNY